jgi:hypothetical protein
MRHSFCARLLAFTFCLASIGAFAPNAHAEVDLLDGFGGPAGFGSGLLGANDDQSTNEINVSSAFPLGLNFFGTTYFSLWVNNNGNVTFSGPLFSYTPIPIPAADRPMIAPYWADVDTRSRAGLSSPADNLVYYHIDTERGRLIVTWYEVGYFSSHNDLRMSFQLILTSRFGREGGDFDVEFRYNRCEWTTGDASQGTGGFGGTPAQAGFDAGDNENFFVLPNSFTAEILGTVCGDSNVGVPGLWRFQWRKGSISLCGNGFSEEGEGCDDGNVEDNDGCSSSCEVEIDRDLDGRFDEFDNCPLAANADQADTDGDRIGDACDVCPDIRDPSQEDGDADGLGDVCDPCRGDSINDPDEDGICGEVDLCPFVADIEQGDSDEDGLGDACDTCPGNPRNDEDADGLCGDVDNCPFNYNPSQLDTDGDGQGNACDNDLDNDLISNDADNCPTVFNPNQRDRDRNDVGDVCDDDIDGDGVLDDEDNCMDVPNPFQSDVDEDGEGDVCDPDADDDDVAGDGDLSDYVGDAPCEDGETVDCDDNCPLVDNPDQADTDGNGVGDACEGDFDGDGVLDADDVCFDVYNPDQTDFDADGEGDACEDDVDGDGVASGLDCDDRDPLLLRQQTIYRDVDGDGRGDASDSDSWCGSDINDDNVIDELDGLPSGFVVQAGDNCPEVENIGWPDSDRDGTGDACDFDNDADGVDEDGDESGSFTDNVCADGQTEGCDDNCSEDANPDQFDQDDDGLGDVCDRCPTEFGLRARQGCPTPPAGDAGTGADVFFPDAGGEVDAGDDEGGPETKDESGCAAAAPAGVPIAAFWMLTMLGLRRRRS